MSAPIDPYAPEAELVARLYAEPSPELLAELFAARAERWPYPIPYGPGPFGDVCLSRDALPAPVAFALIPTAVLLVLGQEPGGRLELAFTLLLGLARTSDTTEVPSALAADWESLRRKATGLPSRDLKWRFLCEWYRRA